MNLLLFIHPMDQMSDIDRHCLKESDLRWTGYIMHSERNLNVCMVIWQNKLPTDIKG